MLAYQSNSKSKNIQSSELPQSTSGDEMKSFGSSPHDPPPAPFPSSVSNDDDVIALSAITTSGEHRISSPQPPLVNDDILPQSSSTDPLSPRVNTQLLGVSSS